MPDSCLHMLIASIGAPHYALNPQGRDRMTIAPDKRSGWLATAHLRDGHGPGASEHTIAMASRASVWRPIAGRWDK